MKLVKKMLAITFTFMMIVGMSTNVKAMEESQTQTDTKGTITVTNVPEGHTYKLYKILNLESYSYESGNTEEGNYAYTLTGDKWDDFVKGNAGEDKFFTITDNKYVTFNKGEVATLAKEAIKFAENKNLEISITPTKEENGNFVLIPNVKIYEEIILNGRKYKYILDEKKLYRCDKNFENTTLK